MHAVALTAAEHVRNVGAFVTLTIITLVVFGAATVLWLFFAKSQESRLSLKNSRTRRAGLLGAACLIIAPLAYLAFIWVTVPGSPLYMGHGIAATSVVVLLVVAMILAVLCGVAAAGLVFFSIGGQTKKAVSRVNPLTKKR